MQESITGKVVKIHSDFIYVKSEDIVFECKIRERLKKEHVKVFTGDNVRIEEISAETNQAVVVEVLERSSYISRPSIANIDQVVVVTSIAEPELDFIQLNRYLCLARLSNLPSLICINKIDLRKVGKDMPGKIRSIYESLGYKVMFTCAIDGSDIEGLKKELSGKVSVLAGLSGVGKSSLLNKICPDLNLKTKNVSAKSGRGIHTTRHTEILEIPLPDGESCHIADTPGFSHLKFDNILPSEVVNLFDDIKAFSDGCYFSDCLHMGEEKCHVIANLDKIEETRYLSYKVFVSEAFEYKKEVNYSSQKEESRTKTIDASKEGKTRLVKVNARSKEDSRKKSKQKLDHVSSLDDLYYNEDNLV